MVEQGPVAGKELRMSPAPFVHELPERTVRDCLAYPGDLGKGDMEVVEREEALAVSSGAELFCGMGTADRAGTGKVDELIDPVTPVHGEVPAILCIQSVCRGVEEVAAHRGRKGKHGRVAGTKEMDAGRRRECPLCGHDHADKVAVPVGLHKRDNRPNRAESETKFRYFVPGTFTEVFEYPALHRAGQWCIVAKNLFCLPKALHCDGKFLFRCHPVGRRRGWDVKRHPDITFNIPLKGEGFCISDRNLPVDRELERAGIGHDDAIKIEKPVEPFTQGTLAELPALGKDVGVRDKGLDAHFLQFFRSDKLEVRVDDWEQRRCLHSFFAHRKPAIPASDIA